MNASDTFDSPDDRAPKKGGLLPPSDLIPQPGEAPEEPTTENRDRGELAAGLELSPHSMVGSYFIRIENGEALWWGLVVGEPQAGIYLCEVTSGLDGGQAQVLQEVERMVAKDEGYEWRFFNTEDDMRAAYAAYEGGTV